MGRELMQLLRVVDQAYDARSWHGTNLRGSVRGVPAARAARRPGPGRHNVWEIVVHTAYWKYAVWRRLTGARRGSFPLKGSNWFERPAPGAAPADAAWRADVKLLDDMHRQLRDAVAAFSARALVAPIRDRSFTAAELISGIAAHDLYHAGQIQLIKRLV